jgi:hypothetical protein
MYELGSKNKEHQSQEEDYEENMAADNTTNAPIIDAD